MAINRDKVIKDMSKIQVKGNSEGLIPAFGVMVNQMPAGFWNGFSNRIMSAAGDDLQDAAEGLLENAAAECGYHTGYGIITSEEFNSVVGPMISEESQAEDVLHGAYGVFTAWGWAKSEIVELIPGEKMVVRAYDYYEADSPSTKGNCSYMIKGVSRAFMDLAYSKTYPDGHGKYKCEQTKGIENGDAYGEFVVTIDDE
ncbi:MAG: hypothetical protein GY835_15490 [bacterium]|nr:hypothetical protein [bacterium]